MNRLKSAALNFDAKFLKAQKCVDRAKRLWSYELARHSSIGPLFPIIVFDVFDIFEKKDSFNFGTIVKLKIKKIK